MVQYLQFRYLKWQLIESFPAAFPTNLRISRSTILNRLPMVEGKICAKSFEMDTLRESNTQRIKHSNWSLRIFPSKPPFVEDFPPEGKVNLLFNQALFTLQMSTSSPFTKAWCTPNNERSWVRWRRRFPWFNTFVEAAQNLSCFNML